MSWARAAARLMMPQLFRLGFDATAAVREIGRMGYRVRRQDLLRDYRSVTGKMRYQDAVESLAGDVRPGRNVISEVELRQPERGYRVFGEIDIYDWDERRWETKNISFYDDYLRTKDEWSSEFVKQFGGIYAEYGQSIQRVNIYSIEHNKGHLY